MKNYISFTLLALTLVLIFSCSRDDVIVPVVGRVVDDTSGLPIENAKIVYNAREEFFTDENGEFTSTYNLKRNLADSIVFFISRDQYFDLRFSSFVGNTQKDIYLIELKSRN